MKSRRSSSVSKEPTKKRKQPKRLSLDPASLQKRLEDDEKENHGEGQRTEDEKPGRNNFSGSKDDGKPRKRKKPNKKRGKGFDELFVSLQANNRALATALEEARVQSNKVNQENVCLKRQLHCERQYYIERIGTEVEHKVKNQFKKVEDCLQETICKLLESTKLISTAIDMVSMPTNTTSTLTPASCLIPPHSCDTTPPPDEPDMEVTTAEIVPMETTITELGNIVTMFSMETKLDSSHLEGLKHSPVADITALVPSNDQEMFDDGFSDTMEVSVDSQRKPSLEKSSRSKRKSSSNVSYAMPSLRSKLRRGDPFTDPFFQETFCFTKSKRKGRMSTGCIQKKPRHALTNLTNIIKEELEA